MKKLDYEAFLHPKALSAFNRLDRIVSKMVVNGIKELGRNPTRGKLLKHSKFRSEQVGDYRIIYKIDKMKRRVVILFIGHSKRVYDDFLKLV